MSRDTGAPDHVSIDGILKSFASRPNVQSTLILSRKDGSIIRATGFPQNEQNNQIEDEGTTENTRNSLSPAQRVASAIHEFVLASSRLAASMSQAGTGESPVATDTERATISRVDVSLSSNAMTSLDDEDVHLLRMRTKKHEIIIFPDANYLNCVVQTLAKANSRVESA